MFHFPKIRAHIVFCPQIGGSQIGGSIVFSKTLEILTISAMAKNGREQIWRFMKVYFRKKRRFCLIYYHAVKYIEALYSKLFLSFNHVLVGRLFYFKVQKFEKSYLSSMTMKVWSVWTKNKQIYCVG